MTWDIGRALSESDHMFSDPSGLIAAAIVITMWVCTCVCICKNKGAAQ